MWQKSRCGYNIGARFGLLGHSGHWRQIRDKMVVCVWPPGAIIEFMDPTGTSVSQYLCTDQQQIQTTTKRSSPRAPKSSVFLRLWCAVSNICVVFWKTANMQSAHACEVQTAFQAPSTRPKVSPQHTPEHTNTNLAANRL